MAIRELGEFGLIDVIQENTIFCPESVVVGIGDDLNYSVGNHSTV